MDPAGSQIHPQASLPLLGYPASLLGSGLADPNPPSVSCAGDDIKPSLILCPRDLLLFPSPACVALGIFSWLCNPAGRILWVLFTSGLSGRAQPATALPGHESDYLIFHVVFQPLSVLRVHPVLVRCVSPALNTIFSQAQVPSGVIASLLQPLCYAK